MCGTAANVTNYIEFHFDVQVNPCQLDQTIELIRVYSKSNKHESHTAIYGNYLNYLNGLNYY